MTVKNFFKSKVVWTGLATICTSVGLYVSGEQDLQELLMAGMGVVFIVLRLFTGTPLKLAFKLGIMKGTK